MKPPDEREFANFVDEIRGMLGRLEKGDPSAYDLIRLTRNRKRIGYPTSSGFDGGSGGGSVSDPTGNTVANEDELVVLRRRMTSALADARDGLNRALTAVAESAPPAPGEGEPGCRVHARIRDSQGRPVHEPVEKGKEASERCWWCNDWRYVYGEDPIDGILEARARGERITNRVTEEEYAKVGRKPPRMRTTIAAGRQ